MPSGSPATQFGAPGGPDPAVAGAKGGAKKGVSILSQMHRLMDAERAERIARTYLEKLEAEGDVALFKEYTARQDGPITQISQVDLTGRTVVIGEDEAERPPDPPGTDD